MRGKKAKLIRKYAAKLMQVHPNIYVDRTKIVTLKRPLCNVAGMLITPHHIQRFSGFRLAKLHARLGVDLEKL